MFLFLLFIDSILRNQIYYLFISNRYIVVCDTECGIYYSARRSTLDGIARQQLPCDLTIAMRRPPWGWEATATPWQPLGGFVRLWGRYHLATATQRALCGHKATCYVVYFIFLFFFFHFLFFKNNFFLSNNFFPSFIYFFPF